MSSSDRNARTLLSRVDNLPFRIPEVVSFLHRFPHLTPTEIDAVTTLLKSVDSFAKLPNYQKLKRESNAEQHCVRCHTTFTNADNGPSACTIPHVFETEPIRTGPDIYSYESACCGAGVEVEEEGAGNLNFIDVDRLDLCYEGSHTTNVRDVENNGEYNEENIRRCQIDKQSGECVKQWLDDEDPYPIFVGNFD